MSTFDVRCEVTVDVPEGASFEQIAAAGWRAILELKTPTVDVLKKGSVLAIVDSEHEEGALGDCSCGCEQIEGLDWRMV